MENVIKQQNETHSISLIFENKINYWFSLDFSGVLKSIQNQYARAAVLFLIDSKFEARSIFEVNGSI